MTKPISRDEFDQKANLWTQLFDGVYVLLVKVGYTYPDDPTEVHTGVAVIGTRFDDESFRQRNPAFAAYDENEVVYYFEDVDELYATFLTPLEFMSGDASLVWVDGVNTLPDCLDDREEAPASNEVLYAVEYITRIYVYAPDVHHANSRALEVLRYNECRQCSGQLEYMTAYITD